MKLTTQDVQILHEGQQLKNAILSQYPTIQAFLSTNKLKIKEDSLDRYFRSTVVQSASLKYNIVKILARDYNDIVQPQSKQITHYVNIIYQNYLNYLQPQDLPLLEKLRKLSMEEKLELCAAKMYRVTAEHYFSQGDTPMAIQQMKTAISIAEGLNYETDIPIACHSDLGSYYYHIMNYKEAKNTYQLVDCLIANHKVKDKKILNLHYYRWGILLNNTKKHEQARKMFKKALTYAVGSTDAGLCIMNIGITHKRQNDYAEALKYYEEALEKVKGTRYEYTMYNNLAELYKCQSDYERASYYIAMALDETQLRPKHYLINFETYVQIQVLKGEMREALNKLMELIDKTEKCVMEKKIIVKGIEIIIQYGSKDEKLMFLLNEKIVEWIKNTGNQKDYEDQLFSCYGRVQFLLRHKQKGVLKK